MDLERKQPTGIIPIVQTPYDADGVVDCESLQRLVDYVIGCGASALITPAVASEVERLSVEERECVVETVVRAARRRVPVIVGASSPSLERVLLWLSGDAL